MQVENPRQLIFFRKPVLNITWNSASFDDRLEVLLPPGEAMCPPDFNPATTGFGFGLGAADT